MNKIIAIIIMVVGLTSAGISNYKTLSVKINNNNTSLNSVYNWNK